MPAMIEVPHLQHGVADSGFGLGEQAVDRSANHHGNQLRFVDLADVPCADKAAVAQHGDAVGQSEYLGHAMANIDDADAAPAQLAHHRHEALHIRIHQRSGRLVHDQHVGFVGNRLGDLDHLPVGDAERADPDVRADVDVEPPEQFHRLAAHLAMVDEAETVGRFAADPDVFGHRHRRHQVQFPMDHGDAVLQRVQRAFQPDVAAVEFEGAGIGRVDAGDDLHQRRLSGAVLAHQGVDAARAQAELYIVECQHAGEFLAHILDLEKIAACGRSAAVVRGCRRCMALHTDQSSRIRFRHLSVDGKDAPPLLRRRIPVACRQFLAAYLSMLVGVTSSNGTQTGDCTFSPLASFMAVPTAPLPWAAAFWKTVTSRSPAFI